MSGAQLVKYEAARAAIIAAASVDEVKYIRDMSVAAAAYARQAKDDVLLSRAIEIRKRAERRVGELLIAMKENRERVGDGRPKPSPEDRVSPVRLSDLAISAMQSSRWQQLARLDEEAFEARLAASKREAARAAEHSSAERQFEKKARRAAREAALGAKQCALPDGKYGVIYADPEWRFKAYSRETGMDRAADNHYPTTDTAGICARDVAAIAADDCALFLWSTQPMLRDALDVMAAWGFTYKSRCVWAKDRVGTGYWFRDACEILLLGTRGDVPAPAMGDQYPSLIAAPAGAHSAKPDVFAEMIEAYFPTLPKIELNRRGPPRPGWSAWGNEAEPASGCAGAERAEETLAVGGGQSAVGSFAREETGGEANSAAPAP